MVLSVCTAPRAQGYAFNQIVPDVRQPVSISGGSACPVRAHQRSAADSITVRWSTALGTNPLTILTQDQTANGRLNEMPETAGWLVGVDWCERDGPVTILDSALDARDERERLRIPTA